MPIGAACIWEVRPSTGSDNNGGGWVPGAGVDYSQQDSPQLTVTDAAATGTTNLSSATGGFTSNMVGNIVNVVGQGRRQITARVDTNNVTCDAAWGTFSGATANVGGAVASAGVIGATVVTGNTIWQKGTYTVTVNTNNVSGGKFAPSATQLRYEGYSSTRGDGVQQTFTASGSITGAIFNGGGSASSTVARYIHFNINSINLTVTCESVMFCKFSGFPNSPTGHTLTNMFDCEVTGACNSGGGGMVTSCLKAIRCTFKNTGSEKMLVLNQRNAIADSCIFWSTTSALDGVQTAEVNIQIVNCSFYKCRYNASSNGRVIWISNCIFVSYSGTAINNASSFPLLNFVRNCAFYNNTSNYSGSVFTGTGDITLSGTPYTDGDNGDFRLNSTAGAGASCKATSSAGVAAPTAFAGLASTTNFEDIGAAQAAPSAGGSQQLAGGAFDGGISQ